MQDIERRQGSILVDELKAEIGISGTPQSLGES